MGDRFVRIHTQGGFLDPEINVYVDRQTGVNYVFVHDGHGAGLTVLVDAQGQPIVTPVQE